MSKEDGEKFRQHLKDCKNCQCSFAMLDFLQNKQEVQSAPLNVIQDIFNKTTRRRFFHAYVKTWKIGFAVAASLFVGFFVMFYSDEPQIPDTYSYDISPISYDDIAQIDMTISEIEYTGNII
jgi:hypothetical protein